MTSMTTGPINSIKFVLHYSQDNHSKSIVERIRKIHILAEKIRSSRKIDVSLTSTLSTNNKNFDAIVHWALSPQDDLLVSSPTIPIVTVDFEPLLPIAGMPVVVNRLDNPMNPPVERYPWLWTDYKAVLDDIRYKPLPAQYAHHFGIESQMTVLILKSKKNKKPLLRRSRFLPSIEKIRPLHLNDTCQNTGITPPSKVIFLEVDIENISADILVGLMARSDLVAGSTSNALTTAALLETPTLTLEKGTMDKLCSMIGKHHTPLQILHIADANSKTLVRSLETTSPLPRSKELELETFIGRILPLTSLRPPFPTPLINTSAQSRLKPYSLCEFPRPDLEPWPLTGTGNSRYAVIRHKTARKIRKLRADPLLFICDAKGTVPRSICHFLKRHRGDV